MPLLEIEFVLLPNEVLAPRLAAEIADSASAVFGAAPGRTWVRLRTLPWGQYAEDHDGPPQSVSPVFATILHARRPEGAALEDEVQRLTDAIAAACKRPSSNVHLFYQLNGAGRVAFGGRLVP